MEKEQESKQRTEKKWKRTAGRPEQEAANRDIQKERDFFYKMGWVLIGIALTSAIVLRLCHLSLAIPSPGCLFRRITHLYCPGCGGTRAVLALLRGHPLQSLYYHPIVVYTAVVYGIYMLTNTLERISKGKWKIGIHYHNWFAWVALAIVLGNCLIRNLLLIFCQMPI